MVDIHRTLSQKCKDAGFIDVQDTTFRVYGHAPKDATMLERNMARLVTRDMSTGVTNHAKEVLELLPQFVEHKQIKQFIAQLKKDLKDINLNWYIEYHSIIARKSSKSSS